VNSVFVVDACRTPIGKVKGALAQVRPDHLAASVTTALIGRNPGLDVAAIDDVYWGAANQAGEDNRKRRRGATRGAATMCIGVGQGIASLWEAA
jgi:acetyl-CoA acetyltransferase